MCFCLKVDKLSHMLLNTDVLKLETAHKNRWGVPCTLCLQVGTLSHMPPEMLRFGRMSPAADSYAFGIMLLTLYTGQEAFRWAVSCWVCTCHSSLHETQKSCRPCCKG
jgi:serine/threonine protein kinase